MVVRQLSKNELGNKTMSELCPQCGTEVDPAQAMGLCPHCLLSTTVDELQVGDHPSLSQGPGAGRCPRLDELNEQIAGFRFTELLGRGGSGWTFLAIQESLARQVAVKVLHRVEGNEAVVVRFRREAESLARLNHPGIVTVHDFGVTESFLFLVMEFVPGPTLRQRLRSGHLSAKQSLDIAAQVCSGVQCAHEAGILHRDIKPENILFESNDSDASVKVADFGIAKLLTGAAEPSLTMTEMVAGTPFYMAPEQNYNSDPVGPRSDVYSIGVVLYEMLTGLLPLGRFPAPSRLSTCNRAVDAAVFRALQNQPMDRTPTVQALAVDLKRKPAMSRLLLFCGLFLALAVGLAAAIPWLVPSDPASQPITETDPVAVPEPVVVPEAVVVPEPVEPKSVIVPDPVEEPKEVDPREEDDNPFTLRGQGSGQSFYQFCTGPYLNGKPVFESQRQTAYTFYNINS